MRRTSAGGTTAIAQQVSTNISDLNTNFSSTEIQDRKMSAQTSSENPENNRLASMTSLPSPPGNQSFSPSTMVRNKFDINLIISLNSYE